MPPSPPSVLDRSAGRVTLLNGDLYYSPNCSRNVSLPDPNVDDGKMHTIFHLDSSRLEHFQEPRWWTATFGWVAFMPLHPVFSGFPLDRLVHIPRHLTKTNDGYYFDVNLAESWFRLEEYINKASVILNVKYQAPLVRPFSPFACGYRQIHRSHETARFCAELSREWFVVWMGLLSYLIAAGKTRIESSAPAIVEGCHSLS